MDTNTISTGIAKRPKYDGFVLGPGDATHLFLLLMEGWLEMPPPTITKRIFIYYLQK